MNPRILFAGSTIDCFGLTQIGTIAMRAPSKSLRLLRTATLLWALTTGAACTREVLHNALTEPQANDVLLELSSHGVEALKHKESVQGSTVYSISVPQSQTPRALRVLKAASLPETKPAGYDALLEQKSIVPTPREESLRWLVATSTELSETLEQLPGVLRARVHLSPAALESYDRDAPDPQLTHAAVLLRMQPGVSIDEPAVRRLLCASIGGLQEANITLVTAAGTHPGDHASATGAPGSGRDHATPTVWLGPIEVAVTSVSPLRQVLAVLLSLNVALASLLATLVYRRSKARAAA